MNPWLFWGPYLPGYVISLRVIYRIFVHFFPEARLTCDSDNGEKTAAVVTLLTLSLLWPLGILYGPGWLSYKWITMPSFREIRETRLTARKHALERAERELREINSKLTVMGVKAGQ